jgi:uncharacterized protein (UPF0261 family)
MPKPVTLVGSLDTKGAEFQFVRDLIQDRGLPGLTMLNLSETTLNWR